MNKPKRGLLVLCFGLAAAVLAYSALYLSATASSHAAMRAGQPELLWLKQEFNLKDAEFQRIAELHAGYLPKCREMCGEIARKNSEITAILDKTNRVTPEIEKKLAEIAQLRAQCQKNMLEHFYAVSRAMPPAGGPALSGLDPRPDFVLWRMRLQFRLSTDAMNDGATDDLDRQDMQRLAGGQDAALNNLMERHGQRLFHYLLRHLSNESDAEDCAQEAFMRVYLHRAKFRSDAKFTTWLYAIATNAARDCHRRHARRPKICEPNSGAEDDSAWEMMPDLGLLPDEQLQAGERSALIRAAVKELPEELRAPLVLFEYENFSQAEIAEILRCTPKAIELRIYRARHALRKTLGGLESITESYVYS